MRNNYTLDFFSVLVIGDNPEKQMANFDVNNDLKDFYVLYKFNDMGKIRKNKISCYEELLKQQFNKNDKESIEKELHRLKSLSDEEYYQYLGELYTYDSDKNIISNENPNGKWLTSEIGGKIFSNFLKDFNDNGISTCKKSDVCWDLTHRRIDKVNLYSRTWDLCVDNKNPESDRDYRILNNMKLYSSYFKTFKDKNEYVDMSTSFWTYAIIQDGIWKDMEFENEKDWCINFYNNYVDGINADTKITIFECTR